MAEPDMTWRNAEVRQAAIQKIEEAKRKRGVIGDKNSGELENIVFRHSNTKEEYYKTINSVCNHLSSSTDAGQAGSVPNAVGMRPVGMQPRPGLGGGYPNPGIIGRGGTLAPPRNEMFSLPQGRPQMIGQNPMMVPNPGMMPANFQRMMTQTQPAQLVQQQQQMPNVGSQNAVTGQIPSPAGARMPGSVGTAMPSPAGGLSSASPGPHTIVPSPANRTSTGIPSPINLNTPGNPGSVGQPNSIGSIGGVTKLSPADEQAYLEKWKQLQKYIDPLKRMINRIDKDEDRKVDLNKMKNLLDILSDSTKRLPIATLLKCEQVLEKQLEVKQSIIVGPPAIPPLLGPSEHMCQALFDAIATHVKSPTLNHTLQRTFGPAVRALHGPPISVDSPPTRKRKRSEEADDGFELDDLIQGEIARLHSRFIVNLDSNHQSGSKSVLLLCKLDDKNLPHVPPLLVTLPENYPHGSPVCRLNPAEYVSPFLQKLRGILTSDLNRLTGTYSLTALLNLWDQCVRKACQRASS